MKKKCCLYAPYAARTLAVRPRGFERAAVRGCRTKPEVIWCRIHQTTVHLPRNFQQIPALLLWRRRGRISSVSFYAAKMFKKFPPKLNIVFPKTDQVILMKHPSTDLIFGGSAANTPQKRRTIHPANRRTLQGNSRWILGREF